MIGRMTGRPETLAKLEEEGEGALIFEKPVVRSGCTGITGGVDFQILLDLKMPFEPETKNIWETGGVLEPGLS